MSETFRDDLRIDAFRKKRGRASVAKIIKPDQIDLRFRFFAFSFSWRIASLALDDSSEMSFIEVMMFNRRSDHRGKDNIVILVGIIDLHPVFQLRPSMSLQSRDRGL